MKVITKHELIINESKADTPLTEISKEALEKGEYLDDEIMAKLIIKRMIEPECEFNGCVLVDFPDTIKQFNLLQQSNKLPKLFVYIEADTENILTTIEDYRMDTTTGKTVRMDEISDNAIDLSKLTIHP